MKWGNKVCLNELYDLYCCIYRFIKESLFVITEDGSRKNINIYYELNF